MVNTRSGSTNLSDFHNNIFLKGIRFLTLLWQVLKHVESASKAIENERPFNSSTTPHSNVFACLVLIQTQLAAYLINLRFAE